MPRKAIAECNLGAVLLMANRNDEALVHSGNVVQLQPSIARCHANLATALSTVGRTPDGIEQLRTAIKLSPRDPRLFVSLGRLYDRLPD